MSKMVNVRYKCVCMAEERIVAVPARGEFDEIAYWVEHVAGRWIADDHREASPFCMRRTMEYAKFAADEKLGIGRAP